jgi:hypothetical protein
MLIPVYGFVSGDTLGVLVLVQDRDTIATLCASLAQATAMRVAPGKRARLLKDGVVLDPALTVAVARVAPLQRVDLVTEPGE